MVSKMAAGRGRDWRGVLRGLRGALLVVLAEGGRLQPDFRSDPQAGRMFRELFRGRGNVAITLSDLHRFGLLNAYLPEFEDTDALVRADPYHRWSVDEHLLQSVAEVDRLERDADEVGSTTSLPGERPMAVVSFSSSFVSTMPSAP